MKKHIKEITEKLLKKRITKDEADKLLVKIIKDSSYKEETPNELSSRLGLPPIGHI